MITHADVTRTYTNQRDVTGAALAALGWAPSATLAVGVTPAVGGYLLLVFADAMPPSTFDLGLFGWVPTLELTVHVRGLPAPGWVQVVQRATLLRDGWLDEECEVWDSTGRLVAQARQLAGYRLEE